jgi:hypothetical protein
MSIREENSGGTNGDGLQHLDEPGHRPFSRAPEQYWPGCAQYPPETVLSHALPVLKPLEGVGIDDPPSDSLPPLVSAEASDDEEASVAPLNR